MAFAAAGAIEIFAPGAFAATLELRTTSSTDDAEEFATGQMYLTSSDLELTHDTSDQTVGMRWNGVAIPAGATITAAWIQFAAKESRSEVTNLSFRGQAADAATTFQSTARDVSSRARTLATTTWSPAVWNLGEAGPNQRTPDLSAVIQEIVDRPGWQSGNAISIVVTGTGHRTAWAFDGNRLASPLLHVEHRTGPPPPEAPPVASLSVTQVTSPPLTVRADATRSTDVDDTPIESYDFDFGDGTPLVETFAPTATAMHTYSTPGTYVVTLEVEDTAALESAPVRDTITVVPPPPDPVAIYVGYYDTHHLDNIRPKPNPWKGSPGVTFVGTPDSQSGGWDSSCLMLENQTGQTLTGVVVTVDIGVEHFALWGTRSIAAGGRLILAQTAAENFDGSDTNPAGCFSCSPNDCMTKVQSTVPVVNVTIGSTRTRYMDTDQVLNTKGVDAAGCPYTGGRNDESHDWQRIYSSTAADTQSGDGVSGAAPSGHPRSIALAPAWPNPARGYIVLQFRLPARGPVHLGMYDVAGRLVRTCVDHVLEPGEYRKGVDLAGVEAGVYFCELRAPGGGARRSFVVTR